MRETSRANCLLLSSCKRVDKVDAACDGCKEALPAGFEPASDLEVNSRTLYQLSYRRITPQCNHYHSKYARTLPTVNLIQNTHRSSTNRSDRHILQCQTITYDPHVLFHSHRSHALKHTYISPLYSNRYNTPLAQSDVQLLLLSCV